MPGPATRRRPASSCPSTGSSGLSGCCRPGEPVTRGTLGAIFSYTAYDELRRLGLREPSERTVRARFPDGIGMLVVSEVLPGSTADGKLQVGDILVRVNGEYLTEFAPLATVLDDRVGQPVELTVERGGSAAVRSRSRCRISTQLSPDEYLQFGDGVLNNLSYQQARHFNRAAEGLYVANPGFVFAAAGIPRGSVIVGIDGEPVRQLDDLERLLAGKADQQRFTVRFVTLEEPGSSKVRVVRMDRRWFPAVRCRRDDRLGEWPCRTLDAGPAPPPPEGGEARFVEQPDARLRKIAPSLVLVNFDMPYTVSGVSEQHYYGTGLVVDAERGYVVVDRNTIPEAIGDVRVTFGGSLEIPGRVVYVHPLHNLALVTYDPALIDDTPVTAARLAKRPPKAGDELWVAGFRNGDGLASQSSTFVSFEPVGLPAVTDHPLPGVEPGDAEPGQRPAGPGRRGRERQRGSGGALVELCLAGYRRAGPGKPRHAHRVCPGASGPRGHGPGAAFAGSRVDPDAAGRRPAAGPARRLGAAHR